jgi:hypothetical protein
MKWCGSLVAVVAPTAKSVFRKATLETAIRCRKAAAGTQEIFAIQGFSPVDLSKCLNCHKDVG